MDDATHTILCVDDEENLLNALKRLLRKEPYRVITALSGSKGLEILREEDVHLIISDQRMPDMSGTEFLFKVKEMHPEIIRIVLTGYTEVDSITDSINKGHIYKLFLKPWNDEHLKLEIREALSLYELLQSNNALNEKVLEQNEALKRMNENLERLVEARTETLKIQNQALELSRAVLENIPFPVLGISTEGTVALINREAEGLMTPSGKIEVGKELSRCFSNAVRHKADKVLSKGIPEVLEGYPVSGKHFDLKMTPLPGAFEGKGLIMTLVPKNGTGKIKPV